MAACLWEALEDLEQVSALKGAQLAWVNAESGALTDISGAVVAEDGTVSFTAPETDGYILSDGVYAESGDQR